MVISNTRLENYDRWNRTYHWPKRGDEWSAPWGGAECQWFGSIFPRIHRFLPVETILEIGTGYGRWSKFLKNYCNKLILVDLSEKGIDFCRKRFGSCSHITYYVNDGISLDMISDRSIDFVFSFDSLVHAECEVLESYVRQLAYKFTANGVGFIHHSNIGQYSSYFTFMNKLIYRGFGLGVLVRVLRRIGIVDYAHWRAMSMTGAKFEKYCWETGTPCISQELVNWAGGTTESARIARRLIDCFSIFATSSSIWMRPNKVMKNRYFLKESENLLRLSKLYKLKRVSNSIGNDIKSDL